MYPVADLTRFWRINPTPATQQKQLFQKFRIHYVVKADPKRRYTHGVHNQFMKHFSATLNNPVLQVMLLAIKWMSSCVFFRFQREA
jgi:hypothetical protein